MQAVAAVLIAWHHNIIQLGPQGKMFKGHPERLRLFLQPASLGYPGVFHFLLFVVEKFLAEQPKMVIQAYPVSGQSQGGDGIQEAGCQPSQASISQGRLQLHLLDLGEADLVFFQRFLHLAVQPQVNEIVGQQFSNQKFRRNIVQFFLSLDPGTAVQFFFCNLHQSVKDLYLCTVVDAPAKPFLQQTL